MKNKITVQVYTFLMDVAVLGYKIDHIYKVAKRHARPDKLLTQALDWGLIDVTTFDAWYAEIVA